MSSRAERGALLLAAGYLVLALHGLGASDVVGDDEAREAGIVQDVVAGHWLWPRFNGELLPDKPILYHWLAALPCVPAGFSERAVRLPSALAGAALVGWTARFGTDLLGAPAGLAAAALLATTPALFTHARVARPDVLLVLLLALALGRAFRWWRDGQRRDASAALALLGAATFAKGPVAPVLFALALGGFLAWQRELPRLPRILTAPGLAAFAVLGLGWYAAALAGWGQPFVREHLVGRYARNLLGGLATGGPYSPKPLAYHLLFYVKHLPAIALPWTPLAGLALWQAWRSGGFRDPRLRFLLCWAAAPLVAFTPAEWKLRYYLLPSLPALALVTAPVVMQLVAQRPRRLERPAMLLAIAAVLAGAALARWAATAGPIALSPSDRSTMDVLRTLVPGGPPTAAAGAGFVAGVLLVALAWRAWAALVALLATTAVVWMAAGQPALEAAISRRDSLKVFAAAVAARYPAPAPLAFWQETIRPVAVYVGRPMPTLRRREDCAPGLALVGSEPALRGLLAAGVTGSPVLSAEGRLGNIARGRVLLLEVPVHAPAARAGD